MADEPRYSDEIRIPISMTLPWSGKLTLGGKPWPQDARGRDWPEGRDGQPEFPLDLLPLPVVYGSPNSIRADFVLRDTNGKIIAIYDAKTGQAQLSTTRVDELLNHFKAPSGTPVFSFSLSAAKVSL